MRWMLVLVGTAVATGCDPNGPVTSDPPTATAEGPLRGVVEGTADQQAMVERFGAREVQVDDVVPAARGGGPSATREYQWSHQARAQLASARCQAAAQCANVDVDACITREAQRLAAWPGAGCRPASVTGCIEAVRARGCNGIGSPLPASCSASVVCKEPSDL